MRQRILTGAALAVLAGAVSACGSTASSTPASESGDRAGHRTVSSFSAPIRASGFPVTVKHRLGSTTIDEKPRRIVALGVSDTDALVAVGVQPVAVVMADKWPWQVGALGKSTKQLSVSDGPEIEQIAALKPDLILATGLGGNDRYYRMLSKVAPTIADVGGVLNTDWRVTAREIGVAVGASAAMEKQIATVQQVVGATARKHAVPHGTSYSAGFVYQPGIFSAEVSDRLPQASLMKSLGFTMQPVDDTKKLDEGEDSSKVGAGTTDLSFERLGALADSDAVIAGFSDATEGDKFTRLGLVRNLPATENDHLLVLDRMQYTASSFVTIGSIPYAVKALEPLLSSFGD